MQLVIERAGHHGQARAGLLVERPESEIVAVEIVQQGADGAGKSSLRGQGLAWSGNSRRRPRSPDESIQYVGGGRDDVFLEPQVAGLVGEGDAAVVHGLTGSWRGRAGGVEIARVDDSLWARTSNEIPWPWARAEYQGARRVSRYSQLKWWFQTARPCGLGSG